MDSRYKTQQKVDSMRIPRRDLLVPLHSLQLELELVGGLEHCVCFHIVGIITPID